LKANKKEEPMTQSKQRALLVGPTFLDIYFIGKPTRLDYSAAIPVVTVDTIAYALGGAGVVAQGLKHLGLDVTLVTALGGGESAGQIAALLDEANIPVSACNLSEYRPPTITRVYTDKRLVACFEMDTHELQVQDHVSDMFKRATTTKPDVIVIADYGK
jgi:bifunctional ADP-heptose synthase (sugar kinase/adenylyltransferase)